MITYQIIRPGILFFVLFTGILACKQDAPQEEAAVISEMEAAVDSVELSEEVQPASPYDTVQVPQGFVVVTGSSRSADAPPMPKHQDSSRREGITIPIPPESRSRKGSAIKREQPPGTAPQPVESSRKVEVTALSDRVIRQLEGKGIKLDAAQKAQIKQLAGGSDMNALVDPEARRSARDQLMETVKSDVLRPEQRALLD